MKIATQNAVEMSLVQIIEDLTQDWGVELEGGITGETLLVEDLDFASVDIIQLCVAIEEYYEQKFGFQDLLMDKGSYISDLSINQMVDFLVGRMQGRA